MKDDHRSKIRNFGALQSPARVSQRSRVRIPYKPEFFSGFLFATAKVAYITAMIILHLIDNNVNFSNKKKYIEASREI